MGLLCVPPWPHPCRTHFKSLFHLVSPQVGQGFTSQSSSRTLKMKPVRHPEHSPTCLAVSSWPFCGLSHWLHRSQLVQEAKGKPRDEGQAPEIFSRGNIRDGCSMSTLRRLIAEQPEGAHVIFLATLQVWCYNRFCFIGAGMKV